MRKEASELPTSFHGYPCPHCGAGVGFNAKRCKECGKPCSYKTKGSAYNLGHHFSNGIVMSGGMGMDGIGGGRHAMVGAVDGASGRPSKKRPRRYGTAGFATWWKPITN